MAGLESERGESNSDYHHTTRWVSGWNGAASNRSRVRLLSGYEQPQEAAS